MKKAIRTGRLQIDTVVPGGPQWVSAWLQNLDVNDANEVASQSFREGRLYRKIDDHLTDIAPGWVDPVTGTQGPISVAGLGAAIKMIMVQWMLEDHPGAYYDPASDLVIIDDGTG